MKVQDFINILAPMAVSEQRRTGILASITIAQGAVESGWGAAAPGNNLFGIKGSGQEFVTTEYTNGHFVKIIGGFRTYDTWEGSVIDHSEFLIANSRYKVSGFFERCKELDYIGAAGCLQNAGYATDPKYAVKLIQIIQANRLDNYDILEVEDDMPKLDPGVALTMINTFLKPSWAAADAQLKAAQDSNKAAAWKEQRDYYAWLANSLRDASGLPRE
ncbi:glucosaminidase domain-containing protein [Paenibacillus sp. WQ 127069]|uniref:Glucosaminidase domain-containing protein n=1 Tax=Paenibacillus baimaensis TaxID=2982185 RepID=A0ABT2UQS2_9BACL|nr:glucosaminidase domain-containing protein [Paenibacillus sp. WQ 127069]MCU6797012.1 glucosaminidase domain-containing protein [Paenibacillus sp. WQ 127069]